MKLLLNLTMLSLFFSTTFTKAQNILIGGQTQGTIINESAISSFAACDTTFSFPAIDSWPSGITYDGTYLWSGGYNGTYIYKHDLTGTVVDSVQNPSFYSVGYMGGDLDFDGTNILFFQEENDTLYKLDPNTGNLVSKFRITPCATNCYGVTYDGTYIWISNYSPKFLYKVDASTGVLLNTFSLATTNNMLPIKFINGKLYGLGVFPGIIYEIDTTSGNVLSTIPWCLDYSLGFCIADNHMWGSSSQISTGGTQRIYQFDSLLLGENSAVSAHIKSLEIFPNPSSGVSNISFGKTIVEGMVEITDILGKVVYTGVISDASELKINLHENNSGVYFVKVFDEINYYTGKIMIIED